MTASAQAVAAVNAAKHRIQWGDYAAIRYALKRGVSSRMYLIAVANEIKRGKK